MLRVKLMAAGSVALFATLAAANPPPGIFSATNHSVSRYPVTLVTGKVEFDAYCGKEAEPLSLVDATGKLVAAPFIVPNFGKFVLTDLEWSAHFGGNSVEHVQLGMFANLPGHAESKEFRFFADRVGSRFATGTRSFNEGPVFVNNSVICVTAVAIDANSEEFAEVPYVQALGYYVDDSAVP